MQAKTDLRARLRRLRRAHVAALDPGTRALVLTRPPAALAKRVPEGSVVGLYHARGDEAPTRGFARWFHENGRRLALPWFADAGAAMEFREWREPWDDDALVAGPFGALQPDEGAAAVVPDFVIVPLVGFTGEGHRLGQGGGHYDRWLAANPGALAVGLAWDCQVLDSLPVEAHDQPLAAVITPTRLYGVLG